MKFVESKNVISVNYGPNNEITKIIGVGTSLKTVTAYNIETNDTMKIKPGRLVWYKIVRENDSTKLYINEHTEDGRFFEVAVNETELSMVDAFSYFGMENVRDQINANSVCIIQEDANNKAANIHVYGTTNFAMAVRAVINEHNWTLQDNDLINEDKSIIIPVSKEDAPSGILDSDSYSCTLLIDEQTYYVGTTYYALDSEGEMDIFGF